MTDNRLNKRVDPAMMYLATDITGASLTEGRKVAYLRKASNISWMEVRTVCRVDPEGRVFLNNPDGTPSTRPLKTPSTTTAMLPKGT